MPIGKHVYVFVVHGAREEQRQVEQEKTSGGTVKVPGRFEADRPLEATVIELHKLQHLTTQDILLEKHQRRWSGCRFEGYANVKNRFVPVRGYIDHLGNGRIDLYR